MRTDYKQISLKGLIWVIIGLFIAYHGTIAAYKIYHIRNVTTKVSPAPVLTEVEQGCFMVLGTVVLIGGTIAFVWMLNGYRGTDVQLPIPTISKSSSKEDPQVSEDWDPLKRDNETT